MEALGIVLGVVCVAVLLCMSGWPIGLTIIAKKLGYSVPLYLLLGMGIGPGLGAFASWIGISKLYPSSEVVNTTCLIVVLFLMVTGLGVLMTALFLTPKYNPRKGAMLPIPLPPGQENS